MTTSLHGRSLRKIYFIEVVLQDGRTCALDSGTVKRVAADSPESCVLFLDDGSQLEVKQSLESVLRAMADLYREGGSL